MSLFKKGSILVLIILVLGLLLYSFLGSSNYVKEGMTDGSGNTYYASNGGTAQIMNANGSYSIVITNPDGTVTTYYVSATDLSMNTFSPSDSSSNSAQTPTDISSNTVPVVTIYPSTTNPNAHISNLANKSFYEPNGGSTRIFRGENGEYAIEETQPNGYTIIYTSNNEKFTYAYPPSSDSTSVEPESTNEDSDYTPQTSYKSQSYEPDEDAGSVGSEGYQNQANNNDGKYNSSLPQGIPRSQIPPGQEDLYILKSEIVPPVCPASPATSSVSSASCPKPRPCPPCARCPEPSMTCKAVPNYSSINEDELPQPIFSGYSTFGM
jgi:hypothetical protein